MVRNCETKYCLNDAQPGRKKCGKCKSRLRRERNKLTTAYDNLRTNAKRRGIYFGISLEEFKRFCTETGYIELKGTGALDMTIDRKEPHLGYIYSNMQLLTNAENIKKRNVDARKGWTRQMERDMDCPF